MSNSPTIYDQILNVDHQSFDALALQIFRYQSAQNPIYRKFLSLIGCNPKLINDVADIPFLPVELWKEHTIHSGKWSAEAVFESSGTTGQTTSKHHVKSLDWYDQVSSVCFQSQYGRVSQFNWLGLLPSYLERKNASLVHMVNHFIEQTSDDRSGFFLNDFNALMNALSFNSKNRISTILIGVSFGLLDFMESETWEKSNIDMSCIKIIETGGMKGRRAELTKSALHQALKTGFDVDQIHSEYGMTELLSQCYSKKDGIFEPSPTMRVVIGDITDPLSKPKLNKRGTIRIIDLANVDTCSFVATQDIGIVYEDQSFEVLGRLDISDLRGCSLMAV